MGGRNVRGVLAHRSGVAPTISREVERATHAPGPARVLAAMAVALGAVGLWGLWLTGRGAELHLGLIPFYGAWRPRLQPSLLVPVAVGATGVALAPVLSATLPWRRLLVAAWAGGVAWAVSLAVAPGLYGLTWPLRSRYDSFAVVPEVRRLGVAEFVRTFVDRLGAYPVHVEGHPPGLPVAYGALDHLGLRGPGWAAAAVIALGATTAVAVLVTVRVAAGESAARRAAPFLVLAPMSLFVATTGDAVYAAVTAWAVCLLALAASGRRSPAATLALAGLAGAVGGLALFGTYGVALLLVLLAAAVVGPRRQWRLLAAAGAGAAAVVAAWGGAGFWWFGGFTATRHFYRLRAGDDRPYLYFLVADLVVFGVILGPAVLASLPRLRGRALRPLVIASAFAVLAADVSGLSKAEVERIWLPFVPWLTVAAAVLPRLESRRWLAASVGLAVVLQATVNWPW